MSESLVGKVWDVFISHAHEDKESVARPLAKALSSAGVRVWLDEQELRMGDSLTEKIDEGLAKSEFGVVILSPAFFAKHWPKRELAGLRARESGGMKVILPVWHNLDKEALLQVSPILADALAANTANGVYQVAEDIAKVIFSPSSAAPSIKRPSPRRRFAEILEGKPDKQELSSFLKVHLTRLSLAQFHVEDYIFCGMRFDAFTTYAGHGCSIWFYLFTDFWDTPFAGRGGVSDSAKICEPLQMIVTEVERIKRTYVEDKELCKALKHKIIGCESKSGFPTAFLTESERWPEYVPEIAFHIFAGRRRIIDTDSTSHATWSNFRRPAEGIEVHSYDFFSDFLSNKCEAEE